MSTSKHSGFSALFEACNIARDDWHLARSFETAMKVTFAKTRPEHRVDARFVRYQECLFNEGHLAEFSDGTAVYDVVFGTDLQLKRITRRM